MGINAYRDDGGEHTHQYPSVQEQVEELKRRKGGDGMPKFEKEIELIQQTCKRHSGYLFTEMFKTKLAVILDGVFERGVSEGRDRPPQDRVSR